MARINRHHQALVPLLILLSLSFNDQYNRVSALAPSYPAYLSPVAHQPRQLSINKIALRSKPSAAFSLLYHYHRPHSSLQLSQNNDDNLKDASPPISIGTITDSLTPILQKIKTAASNIDIPSAVQNTLFTAPGAELGSRGEIYVVLQAVFVLAILIGNVPLLGNLLSFFLGPVLFLLGLATCLVGVGELGSSLSPWPVPAGNGEGLVTDGLVFGEVRHPIYAGLLCLAVGLSVCTGSAMRLVLTLGLYVLLDIKSDYEEEGLVRKFGQEYVQYRKKVTGKFVPERIGKVLDRFKAGE